MRRYVSIDLLEIGSKTIWEGKLQEFGWYLGKFDKTQITCFDGNTFIFRSEIV